MSFQTVLQDILFPAAGHVYNATASSNETVSVLSPGNLSSFGDMNTLLQLLLGFGGLADWVKLVLIGGILESTRRFFQWIYNSIMAAFILDMDFQGNEMPYDWLMFWLSQQESWTRSRTVQVTSANWIPSDNNSTNHVFAPGEDTMGRAGRSVQMIPTNESTHTIWFRKRMMRVSRSKEYYTNDHYVPASLHIRMYTRGTATANALLLEAKTSYDAQIDSRVSVYTVNQYNDWTCIGLRAKRSLDTVVIDEGIKDDLLDDAVDFMESEKFYVSRGLPYIRGYCFYGIPGSGKTSLIHALASELDVDIYVISLSKKDLDDTKLNDLMCSIPRHSIALIEDIDAAFTRSVGPRNLPSSTPTPPEINHDDASASSPDPSSLNENTPQPAPADALPPNPSLPPQLAAPTTGITLSGLLNAIDGIQAPQGRLLFITTNDYSKLDAALLRPGRIDFKVEFKNATKPQAHSLFEKFYAECLSTTNDENEKTDANSEKPSSPDASPSSAKNPVIVQGRRRRRRAPKYRTHLTEAQLSSLAAQFSAIVPDGKMSMASLQGYLMCWKGRPAEAVDGVQEWVDKEMK